MKKNLCSIIFGFIFFITYSCNTDDSYRTDDDFVKSSIKKNTGLALKSYTLSSAEVNTAKEDIARSFVIKIDSVELVNLIKEIKNSKYYNDLSVKEKPIGNSNEMIDHKQWTKAPFGYRFEYFIDGNNEYLEYEINTTDFTIYYLYVKE